MTDRTERDRTAPSTTGRVLRPRAWPSPVRAMTRILNADGSPPAPAPAGPATGRSAVVDCALYVDGVRQPGDWTTPRRWPRPARERARLRLARPARAGAGRDDRHRRDVRAARAGRRGRGQGRAAAQAGAVRRRRLPGAAYRPVLRARRADRELRGRRDRPGDALHRPELRDQRPARRRLPARPGPRRPGDQAGAAAARPVGGGVRGHRPGGRPLPGGRRPDRGRPRRPGGGGLRPAGARPDPADLPDEAGAGGVQAGGGAAAAAADDADRARSTGTCRRRSGATSATCRTT